MTTASAKSRTNSASKRRAKAKAAPAAGMLTARASEIYARGSDIASQVAAFTKANAFAVGAAGRIFGTGARQIGAGIVDDGKAAATVVKGDVTELLAVRSPVDLVRLQAKLLSRNVGAVTAFSLRHAEEMIKLAEASALPIAHRLDVAAKTLRKPA